MADGRANNGGARAGAGRKSKEVEEDLQKRLKKWSGRDRDACFQKLWEDTRSPSFRTRHEARKLLLAYAYGKPSQRVIIEEEPPDPGHKRFDLSQLSPEELEVLERAGEILARARRGAGGEGPA